MTYRFIRKLQSVARLTTDDCRALEAAVSTSLVVAEGEILVPEGATPTTLMALVDGLVCRHKTLPNGRRQILGFQMAGDIIDLHGLLLGRLDHEIGTVTACRVAVIEHDALRDLVEARPAIALAIWRHTLVENAIARQWLVSFGYSPARQRVARLFCELAHRLDAVRLGHDTRYRVPLTQVALADATGMSTVHVNRVLQQLRREGVITFDAGVLSILDVEGLKAIADFDPAYLHLDLVATPGLELAYSEIA